MRSKLNVTYDYVTGDMPTILDVEEAKMNINEYMILMFYMGVCGLNIAISVLLWI